MEIIKLKSEVKLYTVSFLIVLMLAFVYFIIVGYAPFGNRSAAIMDADIQYLDFFAYLKDVLSGKNSGLYSPSYLMGGTPISLIAYYLMSPLNLLVVFFDKSQLHSFFDIILAIKLSLSALTMTIFLRNRFSRLSKYFVILLSISYAFSQYNLAQSSNIMWLDGVYLLPLILLGIYKLVNDSSKKLIIPLLSISIGMSLMFNWYTGIINLLYALIWSVFEYSLSKTKSINKFLSCLKKGICSVILGIGLSLWIFLPNYSSLKNGSRNSFDLQLLGIGFINNPISVIKNMSIGALSDANNVALYSGSILIIGFFSFFFLKNISATEKVTVGVMSIMTLLLYYWKPMYFLFSLFKSVESYWSRYGYLAFVLLIFVSAYYYQKLDKKNISSIFYGFGLFIMIFIFQNRHNLNGIYIKLTIITLFIFVLLALGYARSSKSNKIFIMGITFLLLFEISCNVRFLWGTSVLAENNVETFKKYVNQQQNQLNFLERYDNTYYRVNQTNTRNVFEGLTANYNEGLAYNYGSISSYVSNQDPRQLSILDKLGYRNEVGRMPIVNTSILSSDSLLGVKYILSNNDIKGTIKLSSIPKANGKLVYRNPYAFPLAFVDHNINDRVNLNLGNTFKFQNDLFSSLYGSKINIFDNVPYIYDKEGNSLNFKFRNLNVDYPVYGNLLWKEIGNNQIYNDNKLITDYARWLSPSVFNVKLSHNGDANIKLTNVSPNQKFIPQFYQLNINNLKKVSDSIQNKSVKTNFNKGGIIKINATGEKNGYLYLLIPYDENWNIEVNGNKKQPKLFMGSFMKIKINNGLNTIYMSYHVKYFRLGLSLSIISLIVLLFIIANYQRTRKQI